jgi:hypothetical protein
MSRHLRSLAALAAAALAAAVLPTGTPASAAPDGALFRSLDGFRPSGPHVRVDPDHYRAFRVDTAQVRSTLAAAPRAGAARTTEFSIPTPTGGVERFAVQRTSVLSPELAAQHPEIATWAGESLDHPGTSVAIDVTPMGFHASVRPANGQGAWYVDPAYNTRGTTTHLSYYGGDLAAQAQDFAERDMPVVKKLAAKGASPKRIGAVVEQKVYRLALVTDPTYAEYFGAANVTAEKTTLMNRVNQIYNDDLAINIEMTSDVQFNTWEEATGPDGPCGANPCWVNEPEPGDANGGYVEGQIAYCDVGTLERNQIVLGQLVGASNYDIGHIMLGVNGGGIAGLGVVGSIEKGMGCTGLPDPTGDFMAIDYVAHEMGHQFGGNHTFNGTQWNCSGANREGSAGVEPGSGSSVMAYAGICRQDNLQNHTDPYFSQRTLTEVNSYTSADDSYAAPPVEVQDVAFRGLDDGDSIVVGFPGAVGTRTFVVGTTTGPTAYTAENMATQLSELVGKDVTVAGWGYDPYGLIYTEEGTYPAPVSEPNAGGFQVMFAGDPDPYTEDSDRTDEPALEVTAPGATYVHVGETAKGGAPGNTGFEVNTTTNHNPVVKAPANRTIPTRTPFTLTGSGTDADHDSLVYLWEQNDDARDHDGTALVSNNKVFGPLFRVFGVYADVSDEATLEYHSPGENLATAGMRTRTFPDMAQILAGNTNAKSGKCPKVELVTDPYIPVKQKPLDCYSEFLPTKAYRGTPGMTNHAMHFRLTARDRVAGGGGVGYDSVTLKVDPNAGPFLVSTFAKKGIAVKGGRKVNVAWKVNGTRKLASHVQILLSTNNGKSWGKVLAGKTANDGKATVKLPKKKTAHAWIMVRAVDNYFFDVNDKSFRIK